MPAPPTWTDERIAQLIELTKASKSLDQIATIMKLTRGQVGGKRNRLGMCTPGRRGGKRFVDLTPEAPGAPEAPKAKPFRRRSIPPPSLPVVLPTKLMPQNCTLLQLKINGCHWPLWAHGQRNAPLETRLYCGAKCQGEHSYCAEHYKKSIREPRPSLTTNSRPVAAKSMAE